MSAEGQIRLRIISGLVLLGMLIGLVVDATRTPEYVTEAAISVSDPLAEPADTTVADTAAALATSDEVTADLAAANSFGLTAAQWREAVGAEVTGPTEVVIEARAASGELAVSIADAVAERTATLTRRRSRQALEAAADQIRDASTESASDAETLAVIERALASGSGVTVARTAELPGSPRGVGGLALALVGALAGLLAGFALARVWVADGDAAPAAQAEPGPRPGRGRPPAEPTVLGRVGDPARLAEAVLSRGPERNRSLRSHLVGLTGRLRPDGERPRCVGVAATAGGGDSREFAIALAAGTAAGGAEVLLAECRAQTVGLGARLGLGPAPGLTDYVAGNAEPPEILHEVELEGSAGLLVAITAGGEGAGAISPAEFYGDRFGSFVSKVRRVYDLIVLDLGPRPQPGALPAAALDGLLIVSARPSGDEAAALLGAAADAGVPAALIELGPAD